MRKSRPKVAFGATLNKRITTLVRKLNPVTMQYYDCFVKRKREVPFSGISDWMYRPTKGYTRYV